MLALSVAGAVVLGGALYWGVAWALGSEEARLLTGIVARRLKRN
jgi:hypothetical protein